MKYTRSCWTHPLDALRILLDCHQSLLLNIEYPFTFLSFITLMLPFLHVFLLLYSDICTNRAVWCMEVQVQVYCHASVSYIEAQILLQWMVDRVTLPTFHYSLLRTKEIRLLMILRARKHTLLFPVWTTTREVHEYGACRDISKTNYLI